MRAWWWDDGRRWVQDSWQQSSPRPGAAQHPSAPTCLQGQQLLGVGAGAAGGHPARHPAGATGDDALVAGHLPVLLQGALAVLATRVAACTRWGQARERIWGLPSRRSITGQTAALPPAPSTHLGQRRATCLQAQSTTSTRCSRCAACRRRSRRRGCPPGAGHRCRPAPPCLRGCRGQWRDQGLGGCWRGGDRRSASGLPPASALQALSAPAHRPAAGQPVRCTTCAGEAGRRNELGHHSLSSTRSALAGPPSRAPVAQAHHDHFRRGGRGAQAEE